ncbi:adenylate/guanylate cyclase domain-containing protein [Psychrosphaera sp. 1_MG-2023]|uniref:CHASE2 domain-containing protein n=1 Tax=Psychrosphaera sp. 1_MG-2023 TaxID=3062643 RepID=UPI0026E2F623|nr:adenylate/guanylate cyclase domain-containing protein [Psychrosphaera sp. 1_MG-2023]MDO6720715.1 adenylate/guanylate cyclase domain-containing protein [Psychrosphaera sp. 1_MG-2023]
MNKLIIKLFANRLSVFYLFLFTLITFNYWPSWAEKFSYQFTDLEISLLHKLGYHHEIDDRVVVLDVDDKSIDDFGRWPWPRSLIADMFGQLDAASIVVADMVFSEPSNDPAEDLIFSNTLVDMDNVILGFFLRGRSQEQGGDESYPYIENCALQRVEITSTYVNLPAIKNAEVNIPLIADAAMSCALFSVTADSDGIYRNYPLLYVYQDLVLPTLAVQAFQFYTNKELEVQLDNTGIRKLTGDNLLIENQNSVLLNFPRKIATVSASDVLNGHISPEFFEDKIVLIGLSEIGLYDIRPTALDPYTPGVHLHAAALSNMLQNNWYEHESQVSMILALVSILILSIFAKLIVNDGLRWGLYVGYFGVIFVASMSYLYVANEALKVFEILFYSFVCLIILEFKNFLMTQNRYRSVKSAFSSYVVPQVVESIVEQGISADQKGNLKETVVLFTDIQNFTNLSENLEPQEVILLLNTVFEPVTENIINNEGMLDKYIGDEVMALFNAPADIERYQDKSIIAAIGIQQAVKEINLELQTLQLPNIALSLGLAQGPVIVGNMGTQLRYNYTAVGNTVNLASRITSLSKVYGQHVLVTKDLLSQLSDQYRNMFAFVDQIIVKGKSTATEVYGIEDASKSFNEIAQTMYLRAFTLYQNGDFSAAEQEFIKLENEYQHKAAHCLIERCRALKNDPDLEWDGIYRFDHK